MAEQDNTNKRRQRRQQPVDNTYGKLQPQALDVEKAVLGALMIDKDAYAVICETLRPESFYEPRNQMVYAAIRDLSMEEKPVDMLTVTEQLAKSGTLDEVGGPAYVAELSSRVASSANIEYHANIVAQKSLARQLISFASVIETKAFDETIDVEDLMQEAEGSLFELSQREKGLYGHRPGDITGAESDTDSRCEYRWTDGCFDRLLQARRYYQRLAGIRSCHYCWAPCDG